MSRISELTSGPDLVTLSPPARRLRSPMAGRRVLALSVLAPLVLWGLLDSEASAGRPLWALALLSAGAGLALASYVPLRGESPADVLRSPCAAIGGVVPLACAAATLGSGGSGSLVIAGGFVAFALYQRFGNGGACRTA